MGSSSVSTFMLGKPGSRNQNTRQVAWPSPGTASLPKDAGPRRSDLDLHPSHAAQERKERFGIVGRKHAADGEGPQGRRVDLDRRRRVAVELGGDPPEGLVLERDLSSQPCRCTLHVERRE